MSKIHKPLLAIGLVLGFSAHSQASVVYSLSGDFSYSNNPNGPWSFLEGATLLTAQVPLNNGNPAYPATLPSYWGTGNDLNVNTPDVIKAAKDGLMAGETDLDFLAGDVIVHSPNAGDGVFVDWTAPSDGTIDFSAAIWYAHSAVTRSNNFDILINGVVVDSSAVNSGEDFDRNDPGTFLDSGLGVTAGEVVSIELIKSVGQDNGSLDGISETINFTPAAVGVPEPMTLALVATGAFGIFGLGRLRKSSKAA